MRQRCRTARSSPVGLTVACIPLGEAKGPGAWTTPGPHGSWEPKGSRTRARGTRVAPRWNDCSRPQLRRIGEHHWNCRISELFGVPAVFLSQAKDDVGKLQARRFYRSWMCADRGCDLYPSVIERLEKDLQGVRVVAYALDEPPSFHRRCPQRPRDERVCCARAARQTLGRAYRHWSIAWAPTRPAGSRREPTPRDDAHPLRGIGKTAANTWEFLRQKAPSGARRQVASLSSGSFALQRSRAHMVNNRPALRDGERRRSPLFPPIDQAPPATCDRYDDGASMAPPQNVPTSGRCIACSDAKDLGSR